MMIIWKDIPGYEGHYQVSNDGRIKSMDKIVNVKNGHHAMKHGKELVLTVNKKGYLQAHLSKECKSKTIPVHRLVALAFIENPDNLPCVNHKDENCQSNNVNNLEWCTYEYNNNYGTRKEKSRAARLNQRGRLVNQYTVDGTFVATYPSLAEVKRLFGYDTSKISECARGFPKRHTAYGYKWTYDII